MAKAAAKAKAKVAVLVTTEFRGVFFGYLASRKGTTVVLERARNCLYWGVSVKGFFGLATTGPDNSCRIGPAAPTAELIKVTCVATVDAAAVAAWESAPWK